MYIINLIAVLLNLNRNSKLSIINSVSTNNLIMKITTNYGFDNERLVDNLTLNNSKFIEINKYVVHFIAKRTYFTCYNQKNERRTYLIINIFCKKNKFNEIFTLKLELYISHFQTEPNFK